MPRSSALALLVATAWLASGCERQFVQPCAPVALPPDTIELAAPPLMQVRRGQIRARFETRELLDIPLTLEVPEERCAYVLSADVDRAERTYAHPGEEGEATWPDLAGDHSLHTLILEELDEVEAGVPADWTLISGRDAETQWSGTVARPAELGTPARAFFAASLAPPVQSDVLSLSSEVDLLFLGGDLRTDNVAESTWSGLAHDLARTQPGALVHTAIGDLEDLDEASRDEVYFRWFGGQGRAGGDDRYYAVDLAGVRFVVLDGQDERLESDASPQWRWLEDELQDVVDEDTLREAIVVMHRGPHGLTPEVPAAGLRDTLLPRLAERGVRVLLSGHGHAYQRFDVDGMVIIDDGGGGQALSDTDHRAERDPDGLALRVVASETHGGTQLDIAADGALTITRLAVDGSTIDEVELPAPGG